MESFGENKHPNWRTASPTSSESPVKSFLDPMAMLMAAKNQGTSEVDMRAARALEQRLELQRREEEQQLRLALNLQSEEDSALILAAKQEEEDMLVAQRLMEEDEAAARQEKEAMLRLEQADAELARKTSETDVKQLQDEKQLQAADSKIAEKLHSDLVHEFHTAIRSKNVALVAEMIKKGCDVTICLRNGETSSPLHVAVETNLPSVVKMLIEAKAPVDYIDAKGDTPLHWAAARNRIECINELVIGGATLDAVNKAGFSPIIAAAKAGYSAPIRLLCEKGANLYLKDKDNKMALQHVPFYCVSLKALVERMCGWALLEASAKGRGNEVTDLVRRGASPRLTDEQLRTPLHYASAGGHNIVVEFLLTHKSRINAVDKYGQTPLHRASTANHELVVYTLLTYGADADVIDNSGKKAAELTTNAGVLKVFHTPPAPSKAPPASPPPSVTTPTSTSSETACSSASPACTATSCLGSDALFQPTPHSPTTSA